LIPHETIEKIFDAAQILDVVGEFVNLKRRGVNYLGLCPFHNEKTPSFTVSPVKGIYKCFGCGKGGNAVNFIMEHESLSYPEALRVLARKYNIDVEEKELTAEDIQTQNERESMLVVSSYAGRVFSDQLFNHEEGVAVGLAYFRERGFRNETLKKFEVGYAIDQRDAFTQKALNDGYKLEYLEKTGLTINKEGRTYDRFGGRVIFPIHSLSGQILGFGGRTLRKDPKTAKYLNSPESDIYHKSRILYGMFQARKAILKEDKCFLVEGYTDVLSLHESGIENVVASSGTALTQEQIRLIKRFTPNVSILYDGDEAGIKASLRGIDLVLEEGMNVKVTPLPPGEDPDSFSKKKSISEFLEYIKSHETDFIRFKTELLLKDAENDPIRKSALVKDIVRSIAVIPESIPRTIYIQECSTMMNISEQVLFNEVNKLLRDRAFKDRNRYPSISDLPAESRKRVESVKPPEGSQASETEIIRLLLKYGSDPFDQKENKEEGTVEVRPVMRFIIDEISMDKLDFSDPLLKKIFGEFLYSDEQGVMAVDKNFINHVDPEISGISADLLSSPHTLSKIWSLKKAYVASEEDLLHEIVNDVVLKFKADKIKEMISETEKAISKAYNDGDNQKMQSEMSRYNVLKSMLRDIAHTLGQRVVM
jgi:DNA primase